VAALGLIPEIAEQLKVALVALVVAEADTPAAQQQVEPETRQIHLHRKEIMAAEMAVIWGRLTLLAAAAVHPLLDQTRQTTQPEETGVMELRQAFLAHL
jgi:hypothetical protein